MKTGFPVQIAFESPFETIPVDLFDLADVEMVGGKDDDVRFFVLNQIEDVAVSAERRLIGRAPYPELLVRTVVVIVKDIFVEIRLNGDRLPAADKYFPIFVVIRL